jgi:aminoglycoside phosphotransferase (APT) family kinase protein
LSGSLPDEVLVFLRNHGLAGPAETPPALALSGGVSSDIWRVELHGGPVCVKRALARLRVAQRWEAPVERNVYERRWLETAGAIVPGCAPAVVAADDGGFFAMEFLGDLPLWKAELAAGRADPAFAAAVGKALAAIHSATAKRDDVAREFATDANFHAIRLEPYLLATAKVHPEVGDVLSELARRTGTIHSNLVHGDVSPKNILVGPRGPVFLDAECAWYGDPAFDLAFCLNHLLLKCVWVPPAKDRFLECFSALSMSYLNSVDWEPPQDLEARAATLLPGLLLARIDGKSPVEYLTEERQKDRVRRFASEFLTRPTSLLSTLRTSWLES